MASTRPLGIDIGGSGIKGAASTSRRASSPTKRKKIDTPEVGHAEAVATVIAELVDHFDEVRRRSPLSGSPSRAWSSTAWS